MMHWTFYSLISPPWEIFDLFLIIEFLFHMSNHYCKDANFKCTDHFLYIAVMLLCKLDYGYHKNTFSCTTCYGCKKVWAFLWQVSPDLKKKKKVSKIELDSFLNIADILSIQVTFSQCYAISNCHTHRQCLFLFLQAISYSCILLFWV